MKKLMSLLFITLSIFADEERPLAACLKGTITRQGGEKEEVRFIIYKDGEKYNLMHKGEIVYRSNVDVDIIDGIVAKISLRNLSDSRLDVIAGKIVEDEEEIGSVQCVSCEEMMPYLMHVMIEQEIKSKEELEEYKKKIKRLEAKRADLKKMVNCIDKLKENVDTISKNS